MFRWLSSRARCSPADARLQILRGFASDGLRVSGRLNLAGAPFKRLPARLQADEIDLTNCQSLAGLPAGLVCEELLVRGVPLESLPPDLCVKTMIDASDCRCLKSVPPLQTTTLRLRNCVRLQELPARLAVRHLDISGCTQLRSLPEEIAGRLEVLHAQGCSRLTELPKGLKRVQGVDVSGCIGLRSLPEDLCRTAWVEVADSGLVKLPSTVPGWRILWRRMPVPAHVVTAPETITAREVLTEQNLELRRVMLERMGAERFFREANPEVMDQDQDPGGPRQLLRIRFGSGEDLVCVAVQCPSTGRAYLLRVPPTMQTCRQAVAWTAGFDNPDDYHPIHET